MSTAQLPPQPSESDRGASRGEGLPTPGSTTYYERPLLKTPHWEGEVVLYLFLGGIMGGSGLLAMIADDRPEREADLARSARYVSMVLAAVCPLVLITHLGRPERFLNMLRIAKFKSVMSMGVWGLITFSIPSTVAAAGQLSRDGILPKWIAALAPRSITNILQGLIGGFMAGFAGACAVNAAILALTGTDRTRHKLERLEFIASTAEYVMLEMFRRHAGSIGDPMYTGARGQKLRTFTQFTGILGPAVLGLLPFGGKTKTLLASALTLAGGYVLRETFIEAGKASAKDPRAASRQPE